METTHTLKVLLCFKINQTHIDLFQPKHNMFRHGVTTANNAVHTQPKNSYQEQPLMSQLLAGTQLLNETLVIQETPFCVWKTIVTKPPYL